MLDVMMSDLPRVDYNNKEQDSFTDEEQQDAYKKTQELQEQVKKGGLMSVKGLNLNLNNQTSASSYVNRTVKK